MNSWLTKFKISTALDSGKPLSHRQREKIAHSAELRRFEKNSANLHRALQTAPARAEPLPSLHASVMHSVRSAAAASTQFHGGGRVGSINHSRFRPLLRWLPASALAIFIIIAWSLLRSNSPGPFPPSPESQVLTRASNTLDLGHQITQTAPDAMLLPLSDEWQRLNRDLDQTAQFLLASLP